jgi:hypothetical protein
LKFDAMSFFFKATPGTHRRDAGGLHAVPGQRTTAPNGASVVAVRCTLASARRHGMITAENQGEFHAPPKNFTSSVDN